MIQQLFEELFKPQPTKEMRGVALGDPVDEVIALEGSDYYEETLITPHLQYYFSIAAFPNTEYEVFYYYDQERLVTSISLFLAYNPSQTNMDRTAFEALATETRQNFEQKYGSYQLVKEKIDAGEHLEYSWQKPTPKPGVEVFLMVYDEFLNGNERVMKVLFRAGV